MDYTQLMSHFDSMATLDDVKPVIEITKWMHPARFNFQIRISKSYEDSEIFMRHFVEQAEISFGFEHEQDEEVNRTHVHYYFFGLKRTRQTIHAYLQKYFTGNGDFSMSQTAGKKKRDLSVDGAWCYGTTDKLLEPKYTKNLTSDEKTWLRINAIEFWQSIKKSRETKKPVEIVEVIIEKEKRDNIWLHYYERMMQMECSTWSKDQFKRWIIADYLNQVKAPPRIQDLNRYAFGLWILKDRKKGQEVKPEDVNLLAYGN